MPTADEAFAEFARSAAPSLTRTAWLLCGDRDRAADLVQEALLKTLTAWPRMDRSGALAYARRAVTTLNIDHWRKWGREVAVATVFDRPSGESAEDRVADRDRVSRMLATLPVRERTVLVLRYYQGLSEKETASTLGWTVPAVKSAGHRGLTTLRAFYPAADLDGTRS